MAKPDLSPDELRVLRFVATEAFVHSAGVPYSIVDSFLQRDSGSLVRRLEELGFIYRAIGGGLLLPTALGQALTEPFETQVHGVVNATIEICRVALDSGDMNRRRVELKKLGEMLQEAIGYAFDLEPYRFTLGAAVHGLEPYIYAQGDSEQGMPSAIGFDARLYEVKSLQDIIEARERDRKSASQPEFFPLLRRPTDEQPQVPLCELLAALWDEYEADDALKEILKRDAVEVELCRGAGAHKAVLLLCGSILEGTLLDILSKRSELAEAAFTKRKGKNHAKYPKDASLPDLLELATSRLHALVEPLLGPEHEPLVRGVNVHRDLIHPNREVRPGVHEVDGETAGMQYFQLRRVLKDIAGKIRDGWLKNYMGAH